MSGVALPEDSRDRGILAINQAKLDNVVRRD